MSLALYLKYRPRTFEEVTGQDHITHTLRNALRLGRIAHAYLFTGTRGTGKTSTARILAKAINCLDADVDKRPCNKCEICRAINEERLLDLIEFDAASQTSVDDIRDLREKIETRPTVARYRVYIIDEVHMLSNSAFNALLKTLEEPPPHVIFVLATTEPNKIPPTILSRCQRFDFRRATLDELVAQLTAIAKKEGLQIEHPAVELIARQATGSFRDAASLLDQLMAFGNSGTDMVTLAQVQSLLGASSLEIIHDITRSIADRDAARGIELVGRAVDSGADPRQLARELVDYARGVLLTQLGGAGALVVTGDIAARLAELAEAMPSEQSLRAIRLLTQAGVELRNSASPTLPLELALVEISAGGAVGTPPVRPPQTPVRPATSSPPTRSVPAASEKKGRTDKERAAPPQVVPTLTAEPETSVAEGPGGAAPPNDEVTNQRAADKPEQLALSLMAVQQQWGDLLAGLHRVKSNAEGYMRDAEAVSLEGNVITIGFFYDLHKKKVDENQKAKAQIESILTELFGTPCRIRCTLSPKKQKMRAAEQDPVVREALKLGGKITDVN